MLTYGLVKTTQTVANEIVVNETTYGWPKLVTRLSSLWDQMPDILETLFQKSGSGATVTYTLDRDLPDLSDANDYFEDQVRPCAKQNLH